jgi:hypothetical protein
MGQLIFKKYQIWCGNYSLGQGYTHPTEPQLLDEVWATSFKIACVLHEHQNSIDSLRERMFRGDTYIEDIHFGSWCYNPKTNSNSWGGKYYETAEEAWTSFNTKLLY